MTFKTSDTRVTRIGLTCLILAAMTGCTPHRATPESREHLQPPADFPETYYKQAEAAGSKVLHIASGRSLVTLIVRRGGALARLGHDHVVASHDVKGYVDLTGDRADLYLPLDRLSVDETLLRSEAGLTTQPSAGAIEGTRQNMLGKVLETERYPFALIHVTHVAGDHSKLKVTISLHGTTKNYEIPAQQEMLADAIVINGKMELNQSDFGITPFSILGGALQVQDSLDLNFHILADGK